ncbi:hypothetical protein K504DRAFT_459210 [Pleomassaria siparia CBS 279.74]|uniref:Uncharacterized protein n=1 Tax=Pleomassaria siparia CBS 279.74 TaxID=1314801 RepID=A0A6G1K2Q7_9PLEO|nr:hypothetical protein K504DRAFT_459210 [Pleomassaria siparia CBS 279.74]
MTAQAKKCQTAHRRLTAAAGLNYIYGLVVWVFSDHCIPLGELTPCMSTSSMCLTKISQSILPALTLMKLLAY